MVFEFGLNPIIKPASHQHRSLRGFGTFLISGFHPMGGGGVTSITERDDGTNVGGRCPPGTLHSAAEHTAPLSCPSSLTYWKPQKPAPAITSRSMRPTNRRAILLLHHPPPQHQTDVLLLRPVTDHHFICLPEHIHAPYYRWLPWVGNRGTNHAGTMAACYLC